MFKKYSYSEFYERKVTIFDANNKIIGQAVISIIFPDAFNWKKCKEKEIRVFV